MAKEKINIIIALIVGLILMILSSLFTSITDNIYSTLGEFITYKWLINIIFLLILTIFLMKYYYKKSFHNIGKPERPEESDNRNKIENGITSELTQSEIEETYEYIMQNLSKDEKLLLQEYIDNDTKTRNFSIRNGVAMGLKSMNVLYISSSLGRGPSAVFPFNLQPWAWEMLKKNPKYLKI